MPTGGTKTSLVSYTQGGVFGSGSIFSPGTPPVPTDGQHRPRAFDFPVGQNLQYRPRAYEAIGFAQLRAFANVELVRLAIETRKDQIERLEWQVRPDPERKIRRADAEDRIRAVSRFLRKPDGRNGFSTWMRMLMEDLMVLDAPAIERRWTVAGKLAALEPVDGATIKVLIGDDGRVPLYPAPSYQQVIKGRIWNDLTTRDLLYAPRNLRTSHVYGFGPVEQIIVTINTILQRQTQQLAYFTEGNVPQGLMNAPEGWNIDQIRQFQEWFDAKLSGNAAERAKTIWGPAGSKYTAFKDSPIKDEFDEWLARVVCYCFSLPPTPFVKQVNRATSEADAERALEEGLAPLKLWAKRMMDTIIQDDLGYPDLEFAWISPEDIDPDVQSKIADRQLQRGAITLDEYRDRIGHDPYPDKLGEMPMIFTSTGVVRLVDAVAEPKAETEPPKPKPEAEGGEAEAEDDNAKPA